MNRIFYGVKWSLSGLTFISSFFCCSEKTVYYYYYYIIMRLFIVLIFIVSFDGILKADKFSEENNVVVLTNDNYDQFLQENSIALIEFYAHWCGHCKKLEPEYARAAEKLKKTPVKVPLAKVDAVNEQTLADRFEISGYPTLKFWNGHSYIDYDGTNDWKGIVEWVSEKADPNYKPPPQAVITLTNDNFTEIVTNTQLILVKFFASWCGHCKKLAPEYEKAAQRLRDKQLPILLAKVDAIVEKDLASQYQINGYPTLKIFRHGRLYDYNGPRFADGIVDYMEEQLKPAAGEIENVQTALKFITNEDITLIGLFQNDQEPFYNNFVEAADELREEIKNIAFSFDSEVKHKYSSNGRSEIVLFIPEKLASPYESRKRTFQKTEASKEDILKFIYNSCIPLVGHRTKANYQWMYKINEKPLVVAYYSVDFSYQYANDTQYWRKRIANVAKDYPKYTFAISDEEEFQDELKEVKLDDSGLDVNVIVFGIDGRKFTLDPDEDDFSEDVFRKFMKNLNDGRIKSFVKTQAPPKIQTGPVVTVVSSTFNKIVKDENKDVLIEMYAPWCGHCKALDPIYEELARSLKSESSLVIAKMNAVDNDVDPDYPVEGFPTIYFAPKGNKKHPIKYHGERTVQALITFLKKHAVVSFRKAEL
ncbi:putative protein disulfide-isomerase A4 [Trichinella papuae]|uniref:Protein disulfide-isomerase n=1 Tax=Trichinella papuae TaxID=268474 RepID=A0A0V1N0S3_9BILA|nr:putative protein disulfide-isomerase A4 [Trichinella papuae]